MPNKCKANLWRHDKIQDFQLWFGIDPASRTSSFFVQVEIVKFVYFLFSIDWRTVIF